MEKTDVVLLDSALRLLGQVGFRRWSVRGAEDAAGVPHGTARHHFGDQRGLVSAMVRHLVSVDTPRAGEGVQEQVSRWLTEEADLTRARYELMVAALHDSDLAGELTQAREQLIAILVDRGFDPGTANHLAVALDGLVFDALLRGREAADVDSLMARFSAV